VNASVGTVVAQMKKDPADFSKRVGAALWNAIYTGVGSFFSCLKSEEQVRSICNLASNLIPLGLLAKLITRAPLAVEEIALLARASTEAVNVKALADASKAPMDAFNVKKLADGSRLHEFDSGITVHVDDKPQAQIPAPSKSEITAPKQPPRSTAPEVTDAPVNPLPPKMIASLGETSPRLLNDALKAGGKGMSSHRRR